MKSKANSNAGKGGSSLFAVQVELAKRNNQLKQKSFHKTSNTKYRWQIAAHTGLQNERIQELQKLYVANRRRASLQPTTRRASISSFQEVSEIENWNIVKAIRISICRFRHESGSLALNIEVSKSGIEIVNFNIEVKPSVLEFRLKAGVSHVRY